MDRTLADPLVGAVLEGRYRIRGRIAHGGMATVYDAVDERLERTVAVKVAQPGYAGDPLFIERFLREAKSAAALNHPNVVAVYDQGNHHGLAFLVMEQVRGRTLRDVLADRGRFSVAEAVTLLEAVLDALSAAHRYGLVHRDVKPENVLVGLDGQVKVADFGLARAAEGPQSNSATRDVVMGTIAYVCPELITHGTADTRSDVYSAGIVLFEMLTGSVPYAGDSAVNVAYQHVRSDVPPPSSRAPGIPAQLDELVGRATRRDPGARPSDAGAFLAELRHVRDDLGLASVLVPAAAPPRDGTQATQVVPRAVGPPAPPAGRPPTHAWPQGPAPGARRQSRSALYVVIGLVVLGLVAALTGWWLGAGRFTEAPSLLRLTQQQAQDRAVKLGFAVNFTKGFSETVVAGQVMDQDPDPGGRILDGGRITAVVSQGPKRVPVPDVVGKTQAVAVKTLTEAGLSPTATSAFSATVPKGTVIATNPKPGARVKEKTAVTLVVSKGPQPVALPDLTGRTRQEAESLLARLKLKIVVVEQDVGNDVAQVGRVISQDPGAGTVAQGSTVTLTVGKGQLVAVPNVVGMSFNQARAVLRGLGLKVKRQGPGGEDARVFFQSPPAGTQVPTDTEVVVVTGA